MEFVCTPQSAEITIFYNCLFYFCHPNPIIHPVIFDYSILSAIGNIQNAIKHSLRTFMLVLRFFLISALLRILYGQGKSSCTPDFIKNIQNIMILLPQLPF